jgi:glycosyltransferase involved in cell wall biosynthesis
MKSVCLLLQNHYEPDIRVRRKAETLVAAGYSVDVLALRSRHNDARQYTLAGVNVYTVALGKKRGSLLRYAFEYVAFCLWAFWKLFFLMRKKHYAVVDVNNLPDFLVFAAAYAKWKGAKLVFDMHEITPEFYISKYSISQTSWLVKALKLIERASFNFADHVLAINRPIQELLENRGLQPGKCTVITNSADESWFEQGSRPVGAPDGERRPKFVIMYHGTLTRIYGLDIAIEAFSLAKKDMPGSEFWILGDGPETPALQRLAQQLGMSSQVKFLGRVMPEQILGWLAQCDIGVLATRRDVFLDLSFSNKLSEYVIMGKAVIASRLKAIRYYFDEDALTFFQPQNAADLARQMTRLYEHPELRARLAAHAAQQYAPIGWSVMRERYLQLMAKLAGVPARKKPIAEPEPAIAPY